MDINSIYIIRRDTGVCIYSKDFTGSAFDPQLLSSFLVAMTSFFDEATRSLTSQARAFEGTDYTILVEFGDWTLGAISTKADTADTRAKLRRMINRFEEQFNVLRWVDIDLAVQTRFERTVIDEFIRDAINPETVIAVKPEWQHYTRRPDVVSFLRLIPAICTVRDAAGFLEVPVEIALNLTAEALWENAISVSNPLKPDDIYQVTTVTTPARPRSDLSPRAALALSQLDGETPLSIAAERLRTADLKRFLDEVALLEQRRMVELVSPSQAVVVRYSSAIQSMLNRCSNIVGVTTMRNVFFDSRDTISPTYSWLSYVTLENGVDFEVRSTLTSSTLKGAIEPDALADGFRVMMQFMSRNLRDLVGAEVVNRIIAKTKDEVQSRFPSTSYQIEWEAILT